MGQGLSGVAGGRRAGFAGFRIEISPDKKKNKRMTGVDEDFLGGGELLKSECGRLRSAAGPIRSGDVMYLRDRKEERWHCRGSTAFNSGLAPAPSLSGCPPGHGRTKVILPHWDKLHSQAFPPMLTVDHHVLAPHCEGTSS